MGARVASLATAALSRLDIEPVGEEVCPASDSGIASPVVGSGLQGSQIHAVVVGRGCPPVREVQGVSWVAGSCFVVLRLRSLIGTTPRIPSVMSACRQCIATLECQREAPEMSLSAIIRRSPGTVWLGAAQHVTFVGVEHVSMGTWTIVFRGIQERRSTFVLQPQARWVLRRICVCREVVPEDCKREACFDYAWLIHRKYLVCPACGDWSDVSGSKS